MKDSVSIKCTIKHGKLLIKTYGMMKTCFIVELAPMKGVLNPCLNKKCFCCTTLCSHLNKVNRKIKIILIIYALQESVTISKLNSVPVQLKHIWSYENKFDIVWSKMQVMTAFSQCDFSVCPHFRDPSKQKFAEVCWWNDFQKFTNFKLNN